MIYEKDKINRLIECKERVSSFMFKDDLEWILEMYNRYYIESKDYDYQRKEHKRIMIKYYDLEDDKQYLKDELEAVKRRCRALQEENKELRSEYKACCKKLKSMI